MFIYTYMLLYIYQALWKNIFHVLTYNPYNSFMKVCYYPHFLDEETEAQRTK